MAVSRAHHLDVGGKPGGFPGDAQKYMQRISTSPAAGTKRA